MIFTKNELSFLTSIVEDEMETYKEFERCEGVDRNKYIKDMNLLKAIHEKLRNMV